MSDKNKITIQVLIICIIAVAIIWLLIVPVFNKITANSGDFLQKRTELENIRAEISNFKDFDKSYDTYYSQINKMEQIIFDQVLIEGELSLDLIEFLKNEAQKRDVTIKITPAAVETSLLPMFKISTFRLNISGGISDCLNFISRIEHSRWLSEIDNIVITKGEGVINANFLLKVYAKNQSTI
ncbi:MAG: hypothetical protein WC309_04320 [Candidatus Paceibacterota bacterium]|jgi:hypothetical protein